MKDLDAAMAKVARTGLQSAGVVTLVLGLIIWTGDADQLIPTHKMFGDVLVLSLWTIAVIAARSGVSLGVVALAVAWGLAVPILGIAQTDLVTGSWHWTIQVLHAVLSMGAIAWGLRLVFLMLRQEGTRGGRRPGRRLRSGVHVGSRTP